MKNELIFMALDFAVDKHRFHLRKGSHIPYITHPMNVMETIIRVGGDDEIAAAGVLHDTIEDTHTTKEEIESIFGNRVLVIVTDCSEPDKKDTWYNRKLHTIEHVKKMPIDSLLVAFADKLDNLRATVIDFNNNDEKTWSKFKASKKEQEWYYKSLESVFNERFGAEHSYPMVNALLVELKDSIRVLF